MSSKINHNNRTSRIKHFNKANFNGMVRRKKVRDYYFNWGTPKIRYGKNGARMDKYDEDQIDSLNETED